MLTMATDASWGGGRAATWPDHSHAVGGAARMWAGWPPCVPADKLRGPTCDTARPQAWLLACIRRLRPRPHGRYRPCLKQDLSCLRPCGELSDARGCRFWTRPRQSRQRRPWAVLSFFYQRLSWRRRNRSGHPALDPGCLQSCARTHYGVCVGGAQRGDQVASQYLKQKALRGSSTKRPGAASRGATTFVPAVATLKAPL